MEKCSLHATAVSIEFPRQTSFPLRVLRMIVVLIFFSVITSPFFDFVPTWFLGRQNTDRKKRKELVSFLLKIITISVVQVFPGFLGAELVP